MDRSSVEAAVAALQERLSDGDPADLELRVRAQEALAGLRAAYRAEPALFSREMIETLRELRDLLESV